MFNTARLRHHRGNIFYIAHDGNLEKFMDWFDMGLAYPHDIPDTTYTSLLHVSSSVFTCDNVNTSTGIG